MVEPVKIHELPKKEWNVINEEKDLLLEARTFSQLKEEFDKNFFTSDSINFDLLFKWILKYPQIIHAKWVFNSKEYPPLQLTLFDIIRLFSTYFKNKSELQGVINNSGNYQSTYFDEKDTILDSIKSDKRSIANLDYVNRTIGIIYDKIREIIHTLMKTLIEINGSKYYQQSFVGQIVHGTKNLEPANSGRIDTNVRKIFGDGSLILKIDDTFEIRKPDTTWILHKDEYSLRANNRDVISGEKGLKSDGGDNSPRDTPLIKHYHHVPGHKHDFDKKVSVNINVAGFLKTVNSKPDNSKKGGGPAYKCDDFLDFSVPKLAASAECNNDSYSINEVSGVKNPTIDIQQAYKYCYIWERIS